MGTELSIEKGNTNPSAAHHIFETGPVRQNGGRLLSPQRFIQAVVFQQSKDEPNQFSDS